MVNIKPGISGEILFEEAGAEDRPVGFPTTIYSVSERRILLAQTDPSLSADDLGRVVVFTYVIHKESAPARYRFHARMVGFSDHKIAPGQRVPALVIERTSAPEPCNLRMNFRIKPSAERVLAVLLGGVPVVIVDISEGGGCVRLNRKLFHLERVRIKNKIR